jgi:hypothetical protein
VPSEAPGSEDCRDDLLGPVDLEDFNERLRDLTEILHDAFVNIAALAGTAVRLSVDANPAAIANDEYVAWFLTKGLTDHVAESGDLSLACGVLKELVQTHLWNRMEEVGVPARKYPELGVQFIQTHAVYPSLNRKAAEEAGLTEDQAKDLVMAFLRDDVQAPELIDTDPRINWVRMRGKEFLLKWLAEGYILPDVINAVPKPTVSMRKL